MNKLITLLCVLCVLALASCNNKAPDEQTQQTDFSNWDQVVNNAKGQTVYWSAWGGSDQINRYITWVGEELSSRYQIQLQHIKVNDIAITVNRILAEFLAGKKIAGGSTDLLWINGENFRSMKDNNLLFGPFTQNLPNYKNIDTINKPTTTIDFGTPVDGLEAPWGMAQLVFVYDSARITNHPTTIMEILEHGRKNPGRITYPKPPNYLGTTFLKQALYQFVEDTAILQQPITQIQFDDVTKSLWMFFDEFHSYAWNNATSFPKNGNDQLRLLNDNEIDFALIFSPAEASAKIQEGLLPDSTRTFVLTNGTIGNTHFVAIPSNANAKEAAMVTANFLMSAEAQIRKQDPKYWGDFTVLDILKLSVEEQNSFNNLPLGIATLPLTKLGKVLPEPHVSWVNALEKEWQKRYIK